MEHLHVINERGKVRDEVLAEGTLSTACKGNNLFYNNNLVI